ncbi:MAG: NADH:ubiquinone reductase (Na(+)-transporting) subunit C [Bacteroidetes bacterium]|nr:NADH:ubiquinone reductase (Na(+)-transporting) subunit C [Bacteroidota bacterium]
MYTNGYIFRYAAIMVIIAAALLSTAAMLLKPFQERNVAIDKMGGILASAKIPDVNATNAIKLFNEYVKEEIVVNQDGEVVESYLAKDGKMQDGKAFSIDMKKELYKKSKGEPFELPMYVIDKDGKTIYIIPFRGVGLWGPIWGNLALNDDLNTVVGVTFGHKGETPGLGAEIIADFFTKQFVGKKIFDDQGQFTSILVVKGGITKLPEDQRIHGVDAISGGTITSNGVGDMLKDVLECYLPYLQKNR